VVKIQFLFEDSFFHKIVIKPKTKVIHQIDFKRNIVIVYQPFGLHIPTCRRV